MEVKDCPIAGLKVVKLDLFGDSRGFFTERFHAGRFAAAGIAADFVQDNHSRSLPRVLRGMHYQYAPPQAKLVGVIRGRIWDVAVDVRPGSPTFGRHHAVEITGENGLLFWVPGGFAHGFCVLGDEPADVVYKVDAHYNASGEGGFRFDDADLDIPWPIANPVLSDRDRALPSWRDYKANSPKWALA